MSRMPMVPTTQTLSTTKSLLGYTTGSNIDLLIDLFDESFCEFAEETLLHHELKPPSSSLSHSSLNLFELP